MRKIQRKRDKRANAKTEKAFESPPHFILVGIVLVTVEVGHESIKVEPLHLPSIGKDEGHSGIFVFHHFCIVIEFCLECDSIIYCSAFYSGRMGLSASRSSSSIGFTLACSNTTRSSSGSSRPRRSSLSLYRSSCGNEKHDADGIKMLMRDSSH